MNWLTIISLIFQFGPQLFSAIASLINAIRTKNAAQGQSAVSGATDLAAQIVRSLAARSNMTTDQKREQAWQDLIAGMKSLGVTLSETNARTLTQLAYQDLSGK